ncbi:MAG: hypothetical protein ACRCWC_04455 [Plesiomonas shigelloides]
MQLRVANIDDHLDMVLPLLAELCRRDQPDWTVDDALNACRTGRWLLVVGDEPGFAMFSLRQHRFAQHSQLCVEVMCHPHSEQTVSDYQPFMDVLARNLGCEEICMTSKRRGWERKGWTGGWIHYSRPVQEVTHAVVS